MLDIVSGAVPRSSQGDAWERLLAEDGCTVRAHLAALGLLLIALLGAAACSSGGGADATGAATVPGAQRVVLKATDALRFEPSDAVVDSGRPVQVLVQNDGKLVHDATFADGLVPDAGVSVVAEGNTRMLGQPITFSAPGTYHFICAQPGHAAAGMVGTIVVR